MLRPSRTSAARRQGRARLAPSQTAAASSKVIPAGLCASGALSRMQTNSAWAPDPLTPKTWSPTSNSVTAAPTASTSPANSMPRIFRFGRRRPVKNRLMKNSALRSPQSVRLTVVAWILTRTSSSFGTGRSTSARRRTSGGPYLSWTTALISPPLADRWFWSLRPLPYRYVMVKSTITPPMCAELGADDRPLRSQESGEEAGDEVSGGAESAVRPVDGRGVNPHENLVFFGDGGSTSSIRRASGRPYLS